MRALINVPWARPGHRADIPNLDGAILVGRIGQFFWPGSGILVAYLHSENDIAASALQKWEATSVIENGHGALAR